jgi:proteasome assembly chaperone 3
LCILTTQLSQYSPVKSKNYRRNIMASMTTAPPGDYVVTPTAYPARTKTSSSSIKGLQTTATTVNFADKILITVTQNGRLAHWVCEPCFGNSSATNKRFQVHVPLDIAATDGSMVANSYLDREDGDPESDLLPMHHLTATTILGGTIPELDILGQTLATQVATALKTRDERETRTVVLGMGLDKSMIGREEFSELVGLVLEVV